VIGLTTVFGARRSLQRRLVVNVVLALLACVLMATIILVSEFYDHLDENAEAALLREAEEVAATIDPAAPEVGLDAAAVRFVGDAGAYRYTVFDARWTPLVGGEFGAGDPEVKARLERAVETGHMVSVGHDRLGVVVRRALPDGEVFVLATARSTAALRTQFASLRHEFSEQIGWVVFGVVSVLAAAILAARRSLRPLRLAMMQATRVTPGAPERRLTADGLPDELRPLIEAVNGAFDRLEKGYQAQRDFSSNVAHEIRTPLAVLRSGIEALEDPALRLELSDDLSLLDRLFEQLIDLARAEALATAAQSDLDLHELALDLAMEMSAPALRAGRTLAVTGATHAPARGHAGLLTVALGNLVRNALAHSPEGSEVEIEVQADPPGWRVLDRGPGVPEAAREALFERFQRGAHGPNTAPGAGIGLAIVRTVAEAHRGTVTIEDRPGGGAAFLVELPPVASQRRTGGPPVRMA
jgi:signal transduction histidine kinase